jgi:hypothetical protein
MPTFRYFNTDEEVRVGDVIRVKRLFRSSITARVVYVPGQSKAHSDLEYDDVKKWAYQTDDGTVWAGGYDPNILPFAARSISFVQRSSDPGISPDYELQ